MLDLDMFLLVVNSSSNSPFNERGTWLTRLYIISITCKFCVKSILINNRTIPRFWTQNSVLFVCPTVPTKKSSSFVFAKIITLLLTSAIPFSERSAGGDFRFGCCFL